MDDHMGHSAQDYVLDLDNQQRGAREYLKYRIEDLKNLQRKHKTIEDHFHTTSIGMKEEIDATYKILEGEGVAQFWLSKMKNIEVLARKITKLDEGAFQHLRNILCTETPTGFKLDFFFDSNPYFKDSVLTKTFMIIRGNKHEVTNAIGMEIEWYLGKSLTDTENGDSFFNFFKTPVANSTAEDVQTLMDHDYCIGSTIRDKIIENKDLAKDLLQELRFFRHGNYTVYKHRLLRLRYLEVGAQVEAAYLNLYKPIYEKRYEIVNGITKVGEKDEVERDKGDEATKEKGIPQFWLTAMKNHKLLAQEITEHDEEALKYLKDIKWYRIYGGSFRLEFVFQQPNPYFENEVLTKSYKRPLIEKTTGCVIKWHHGKDLTHKFLEGMSKNSKRMTKSCESFFNFFNPPQLCLHEKHIDYNDGYLNEEVKSKLNYDFYIGKIIRDKIIPHAISWFTREALEPGGEFEDLQDDWYDYSDDDEDAEAIKNL